MSTPEPVATPATAPAPRSRIARWLDVRFRSATAIYGLIVFAAFLSISSDHVDDDGIPWDSLQLLEDALPALLIFYVAHVFAHTLTDHGEHGFGPALRRAVHHSSGMLWSALPSLIILTIGALTNMPGPDAYEYTMLATVVMLAVLGFAAYSARGARLFVRILGALGTGMLGVFIILLEYSLH